MAQDILRWAFVSDRSAARIALPGGLVVVARIVGACLAYLAVLDLTVIAAYAIGQTLVPDAARGSFGLVALGLAEAAALASVLLVWRLVDRRRIAAIGMDANNAPRRRWLKGALVAALMMGFVVLIGYTLVDGASWNLNSDATRAAVGLIAGLLGFAIQGPAEEVLFRGYILVNVRQQWGLRPALIVSSLAFGLLHVSNPAFGILPFINLVLFGLGMSLYRVYVDADQLWGVFAIHSIWNWLQQVVFGLPNSGITSVPDLALFTVTPNASLPGPLWGGGFGPEGTLAASLALLALIFGSLRVRRLGGGGHLDV
jgi:membrane protease YdiL (CAAX protease family)